MNLTPLLLLAFALAAGPAVHPEQQKPGPATAPSSFKIVDIYIDSGPTPLAAYEFEFMAMSGDVQIVGIEKGDSPLFGDPPYYDPAALSNNRIIIGSFNTTNELPTQRSRVARLHLHISGNTRPQYALSLIVAGSRDGTPIAATASFKEGE